MLYDSQALRGFAGIALNREPLPDATTLLKYRHWLEHHELTKTLFDEVGAMLEERGLLMRQGTIVDATIIATPPSTKKKEKSRAPENASKRVAVREIVASAAKPPAVPALRSVSLRLFRPMVASGEARKCDATGPRHPSI